MDYEDSSGQRCDFGTTATATATSDVNDSTADDDYDTASYVQQSIVSRDDYLTMMRDCGELTTNTATATGMVNRCKESG